MNYKIEISDQAADDTDIIYVWIAKRSQEGAARWYREFLSTMEKLKSNPERHALAPEAHLFPYDVR